VIVNDGNLDFLEEILVRMGRKEGKCKNNRLKGSSYLDYESSDGSATRVKKLFD